MKQNINVKRVRAFGLVALAAWSYGAVATTGFAESSDFVAAVYRPDTPFPEYMPLWREGWKWLDANGQRVSHAYEGMPLGGYLQVYVGYTGKKPLEIRDVLLNGVSLTQAIVREEKTRGSKYASSVLFSKLPQDQVDRLMSAGEPVWWKVDPQPVPAGGMAEVTIRLRRKPRVKALKVALVANGPTLRGTVAVDQAQPRVRSISFSPKMDKAYLYVRHPDGGGVRPSRILVDGKDMTSRALVRADQNVDTAVVVVTLPASTREPRFHCFQAVYPDGSAATAAIRAWEPDFKYGMWGIPKEGSTPEERARIYVERLHEHNINVIMSHYGGDVRKFVASKEGSRLCGKLGMRIMDHTHGAFDDPIYYYLPDEPDAHDFAVKSIDPPDKRLGSLAQSLVEMGHELRRKDPDTLQLCNVDNTYKPEQWYMYAQLPDVISADPYYPEQLRSVYRFDPARLGSYTKPTYVYAVGEIYGTTGAPKPMHMILHTCRFDMEEYPFRAPTPAEKRIEVYYALAAGAKGVSYWWYTPAKGKYYGCGGKDPDMMALMTEIGLLGAEARTAGPVLVKSCPVTARVEATRNLWVRTLMAGLDTFVLVIVNDNIACDRAGITVKPVEKARVSAELPEWLTPHDAFEVDHAGTRDVDWTADGSRVTLELGDVELTRLIVVSADAKLRSQLQRRYQAEFADNTAKLAARRAK